jgi:D-alanyl-D-alanine carboxypeptidase/D-alanyl-D-alanine-endopeptidase (penicillin-binding protein 4)
LPSHGVNAIVRGTIPVNEDHFQISGSMMNPAKQFVNTLEDSLKNKLYWMTNTTSITFGRLLHAPTIFYTHYSPTLDSIIYWFLKKSINLYGEALIKNVCI